MASAVGITLFIAITVVNLGVDVYLIRHRAAVPGSASSSFTFGLAFAGMATAWLILHWPGYTEPLSCGMLLILVGHCVASFVVSTKQVRGTRLRRSGH
jgi:hypothetical protein